VGGRGEDRNVRQTRYREEVCTRKSITVHTRFTVGLRRVLTLPTPVSLLVLKEAALSPVSLSSRTFLRTGDVRKVYNGNVENVLNLSPPRVYSRGNTLFTP